MKKKTTRYIIGASVGVLTGMLWADPVWWTEREVLSGATPNDYAVINQGQLKYLAEAAYHEFEQYLAGGSGYRIDGFN